MGKPAATTASRKSVNYHTSGPYSSGDQKSHKDFSAFVFEHVHEEPTLRYNIPITRERQQELDELRRKIREKKEEMLRNSAQGTTSPQASTGTGRTELVTTAIGRAVAVAIDQMDGAVYDELVITAAGQVVGSTTNELVITAG